MITYAPNEHSEILLTYKKRFNYKTSAKFGIMGSATISKYRVNFKSVLISIYIN